MHDPMNIKHSNVL